MCLRRFENNFIRKVIEIILRGVCKSHKIDVSDSFLEALDDYASQETLAMAGRHARHEKNRLGKLRFQRKMKCYEVLLGLSALSYCRV